MDSEDPPDEDALLADVLIIQQYQSDTIASLTATTNPFGKVCNNKTNYDVIPKVFKLHILFTNFCEKLTELVLSHGTYYVESLISHYEYTYKNLLQLLINLSIIDEEIVLESIIYPFELKCNIVDDYPVAIDMGGTLAKIAYVTSHPPSNDIKYCIDIYNTSCKFTYHIQALLSHITKSYSENDLNCNFEFEGRIHNFPSGAVFERLKGELMKIKLENGKYIGFKIFKNNEIDKICQFIQSNVELNGKIYTTGGYILKYRDQIESLLGAKTVHFDEMESISTGLNFLSKIENSLYKFNVKNNSISTVKSFDEKNFLVVNVGSGTSIIKISPGKNSRVNGSTIGGGIISGSFHHITKEDEFSFIQLCSECVYNTKIFELNRRLESNLYSDSLDCVRMIYNDLGILGQLTAKQFDVKTVIFTGYAIFESVIAIKTLTSVFKSNVDVLFSYHGGYSASLGALTNGLYLTV